MILSNATKNVLSIATLDAHVESRPTSGALTVFLHWLGNEPVILYFVS
jgi:hypothetical protein